MNQICATGHSRQNILRGRHVITNKFLSNDPANLCMQYHDDICLRKNALPFTYLSQIRISKGHARMQLSSDSEIM